MSERKINLEEILLKNHFHILDTLKNVYSPDTHTENMYERLMNGIKDVCEKTLELATENAIYQINSDDKGLIKVVNESILNTIKQIE